MSADEGARRASPGVDDSTDGLLIERDGGVTTLTLNRPEKLNAFTREMKDAVERLIHEIEHDDEQKVLVITGTGRGFCSGFDISGEAGDSLVTTDQPTRHELLHDRWFWISGLRRLEKPVIAGINGVTAGLGFALALVCDVRFASDEAQFIPVFNQRALVPDAGTSYLLPRAVGPAMALKLLWSPGGIGADEALRVGLVEEIVPHAALMDRVRSFAADLAAGPSVAIELTKRAIYRGVEAPSLRDQAEYEEYLWSYSHAVADYREGHAAFNERREPKYTGR